MIEIISDFFIKKYNYRPLNGKRRIYGIVCSLSGVMLNLIMFAFKMISSIFSGSVAAAVDAIHNLTDSASSVVTLLSFILSGQEKTKRYPMGKGRIEYVAGFIVAVVLISAGLELAKASITKIITPEPVTYSPVSVVLLLISFVTKLYMAYFNSRIGKKISSEALKAAATDCLCDAISTLIALSAIIAVRFTNLNIDAWGGLAVSLFILFAGCKAAKDTVKMLVGMPVDDELREKINNILTQTIPEAKISEIMLHDYGPENRMLTVKIIINNDCDVKELCKISATVKRKMHELYGYNINIITDEYCG